MTVNIDNYEIETEEKNNQVYIKSCKGANMGQSNLKLTIPDEINNKPVVGILKKAFFCINSLKTVILPGTISYMGDWAFSNCPILKDVLMSTKPKSVASLERGVFDGCNRMERIDLLGDGEGDAAYLLGSLATKLSAPYLLRDPEIGSDVWYAKWDMALLNFLATNDYEGYSDRALCGEEDISYDGIGSVDGEFLGESFQYIKEVGKAKAGLALLRLKHASFLLDETGEKLKSYIIAHSKGCAMESAWYYVTEDMSDDLKEFEDFIDIVSPDSDTVDLMLADLKGDRAHARAFLINYKKQHFCKADAFDDFAL